METNTSRKRCILAVGALHVDELAIPFKSLVPEASNPVQWTRFVGGVAANTLLSLKLQQPGMQTHLLAAMGDDALGESLTRAVEEHGVSLSAVRIPDRNTGRYTAVLDAQGELFIGLADVSLSEHLSIEHVQSAIQKIQAGVVILDANLSSTCLDAIAEHIAEQRRDTSSAPSAPLIAALAVSPEKSERLRRLAPVIDLLFCNRREAAALNDRPIQTDLKTLGHGLSSLGFNEIVLTDGADALWVRSNNETRMIDVPATGITQNVNGAGDALAGATLAHWSIGKNLCDSVLDAGLVAAAQALDGSAHTYLLDQCISKPDIPHS